RAAPRAVLPAAPARGPGPAGRAALATRAHAGVERAGGALAALGAAGELDSRAPAPRRPRGARGVRRGGRGTAPAPGPSDAAARPAGLRGREAPRRRAAVDRQPADAVRGARQGRAEL